MSILRHGIQRDFPEDNIRQWGCHFLTLMKYAELRGGNSPANINAIKGMRTALNNQMIPGPNGRQIPVMRPDCFINDPIPLLNRLGLPVSQSQRTDNAPRSRPVIVEGRHPQWGLHFWLILEDGTIWDSMGFNSLAQHAIESYRVFI